LPWHIAEEAINRESQWLQGVIEQTFIDKVPGCDECRYTFRKIALLIITGRITAKEFIARNGHDSWDDLTQKHGIKKSARHGGDWHKRMIVTKYAKRCGLPIKASPHTLRQGFATYLAEEGANPAAIQILLGHESLDTTARYVHASDKYAEEAHRKYHP